MLKGFRIQSFFHNVKITALPPMEGGQQACRPRETKKKLKGSKKSKTGPC